MRSIGSGIAAAFGGSRRRADDIRAEALKWHVCQDQSQWPWMRLPAGALQAQKTPTNPPAQTTLTPVKAEDRSPAALLTEIDELNHELEEMRRQRDATLNHYHDRLSQLTQEVAALRRRRPQEAPSTSATSDDSPPTTAQHPAA